MSLKKNTRERIKKYILEKIDSREDALAKKVAENFNISLTTVYRCIKELYDDELIEKKGNGYKLRNKYKIKKYSTKDLLEEDRIFEETVYEIIKKLPDNVYRIWQYAFTEMMNNAIDHANAKEISVVISHNCLNTIIQIEDDGVGIFQKIKEYYKYSNLDDAVNELFKGKLTTDSRNHTGEGIFFTSRMIEIFAVLSGGKIFTHSTHFDITRDICSVPGLDKWKDTKGTIVLMKMPNNSRANIKEVFDMFSGEDDKFSKTQIPLKHIFTDGFPVSRSQAKRLSTRFEDFEEIILDFNGIDDIGQGFAHELFVVFKRNHPKVTFIVENENDDIKKMISHVTSNIVE
ncbi:DUF4325 domain-containing protein [Faecalicatena contorta]|uniref:STAS-like domain-containing protein n=1 Tax=Faecalicatena contorta TaxID=39482 RepID=UPI00129DB1FB|nr:DUF4325 domain-containing protein [Faecalicatena contorta]MRM91164.1 DUF4325 domain-containing protein [Faecalicatena contorta]